MAVPYFQSLMLPLLKFSADGEEHTMQKARDVEKGVKCCFTRECDDGFMHNPPLPGAFMLAMDLEPTDRAAATWPDSWAFCRSL